MYENYQIVIDDPASVLALGFDDYAASLAEIVRLSRPQFAVGVFGQWGSGKTTLMRAIERDLKDHAEVVPIWFNAWRYEKEQHLIVPLLDTIREQVLEWADRACPTDKSGARTVAAAMGRAAKAILSGLSIKAGFPGAIQISLDANKIATGGIDRGAEDSKAYEPKSFYHASFLAMRSAVEEFLGSSTNGADPAPHANAANRFVVLVDDLDRCVPKKALEVLESMKLFFDLPGFVFVVGLDQQIIEQAVLNKYPAGLPSESGDVLTYISGVDYVKKIFQIQFAVPRVDEVQLAGYIDAMGSSGLPPDQVTDLKNVVVPRAGDMIGTSPLNPREVKRLVNAYTMQLKLLERKLAGRGSPDPSAVLALAIFSFRADWDAAYQALSTSPIEFLDNASDALRKDENTIAVAADLIDLPPSLTSFLAGNGSSLFGLNDQIEVYLSALEAARTIDPDLREISKALGGLRVAHANGSEQGVRERLSELMSRMTSRSSQVPPGRLNLLRNLQERVPQGKDGSEEVSRWLEEVGVALPQLASTINDLQRRSVTAGSSAA